MSKTKKKATKAKIGGRARVSGRSKSNEERILEFLKKYQCRALHIVPGEMSANYREARAHTIRTSKIASELSIPKQTVSNIVWRLYDLGKIVVHRFGKDYVYIPEENYDKKIHKSTELRAGTLVKGEYFVGENLIREFGANLIGNPEILKFVSFTRAQPDLKEKTLSLHFPIGAELFHLNINRSLFNNSDGSPLVIFLGSNCPGVEKGFFIKDGEDEYLGSYNVGVEHVERFGPNTLFLSVPNQSLRMAEGTCFTPVIDTQAWNEFYDLGKNALVFYPDLSTTWVFHFGGRWTPNFVELDSSAKLKSPQSVEEILDFYQWTKEDQLWPYPRKNSCGHDEYHESCTWCQDDPIGEKWSTPRKVYYTAKGTPLWDNNIELVEDGYYRDEEGNYYKNVGKEGIQKTRLKLPTFMRPEPWFNLKSTIREANLAEAEEAFLEFPWLIDAFENFMARRLKKVKLPVLLSFREFHIVITN